MKSESITDNSLEQLNEVTMKELDKGSLSSVKKRVKSQNLRSTYLGVNKEGIVMFKTTSGTTPGRFWYQYIKFKDLDVAKSLQDKDKKLKNKDIINLVVYGDIAVYCNDLSFKYYGWQYLSWSRGYGIKKETRYPKKRNPYLKGTVCKHLLSVLDVLPFHINTIVRDMKRRGILK